MKIPKQKPAVKRDLNQFAGVAVTSNNVSPSGFLDILKKAAGGALSALAS